jgi:DNA repair exonuclease SbcCD ATPase subunit
MSEDNGENRRFGGFETIENSVLGLRTVVAMMGVIALGAMEFRNIRNEVDVIKEDKIPAVIDKANNNSIQLDVFSKELLALKNQLRDQQYDNKEELRRLEDRFKTQIQVISERLNELESGMAGLRRNGLSKTEDVSRDVEKLRERIEQLDKEIDNLKDLLLKMNVKPK